MVSLDLKRLLTSAEKRNDYNYRGLVYRAHPNEPSCACPQIASGKRRKGKKQQQQQQQQESGSAACRSRLNVRQRKDANDPGTRRAHFMPTHCARSTKNDEVYSGGVGGLAAAAPARATARMRGGGNSELGSGFFSGDADFTWYNDRFTMQSRLEGGGGGETYPTACCGKAQKNMNEDFLQWNTINPGYLAANKCKLRPAKEDKENKSTCSCPDKDHLESVLKKKGHAVCMKKPCFGTDCLIKAFKDAQEFVDSIGKVPGLAGLGLVESPYFGNKPSESKEVKRAESRQMSSSKPLETTNTVRNSTNQENLRKLCNNAAPNTFTSAATKKPGVVQEGVTTFPESTAYTSLKLKKKDEKIEKPKETESNSAPVQIIEDTPCGEPKCKSRPKKVITEMPESEGNSMRDKSASQKNDRRRGSKSRASKSTPRLSKGNQFIYSFGNNYPASVYGHKKCNQMRDRVPAHMGWMWNQYDAIAKIKPRPGWRPGAISVQLRDILREAKEGFFNNRRPRSAPSRSKKDKLGKTKSFTGKKGAAEEETEEEVDFPPTLHIHRKDGVYYVTMYPIRQDTDTARVDEPINPLQFKIVKSKGSIASSSTASDMEIEFSPPAAVNRLKKKPNVIHVDTQVKQQEIIEALKKLKEPKKKDSKGKKDKGKKK